MDGIDSDSKLDKLRDLILRPEQDQIADLQHRFDNKEIFSEEISNVLAEAIIKRNTKDSKLSDALYPTVEEAVKTSVTYAVKDTITKDMSSFADALYPVMGPAIRRSISEAFKEMLATLNVALENSFSRQGLLWRLESIRTGRSFSEIVLLRSLVFRVEQVFLIHRETGNLLHHVAIDIDDMKDADMVSGMLTAISDFVQDSFSVNDKSILDSIKIGDLTVLIESGPLAIMAVAIRGNAPSSIREEICDVLEKIHRQQAANLSSYRGDSSVFDESGSYLENCLKAQYKEKGTGKKTFFSLPVAILFLIIVIVLGWWGVSSYQYHQNWNSYIDKLAEEPGIVVTDVTENSGHYSIHGLRDPLAKMPQQLRTELTPVAEKNISYHFEPYQALIPEFVLKRVSLALAKPENISFKIKQGVLIAEGVANHQWRLDARNWARLVAGVIAYDDSKVITSDIAQINTLKQQLEQKVVLFKVDYSKQILSPLDKEIIFNKIKKLFKLSEGMGKRVVIDVIGHADGSGNDKKNINLSQKRANYIFHYLVDQGIPKNILRVKGIGSAAPVGEDPLGLDKGINRSVTFTVSIDNL